MSKQIPEVSRCRSKQPTANDIAVRRLFVHDAPFIFAYS